MRDRFTTAVALCGVVLLVLALVSTRMHTTDLEADLREARVELAKAADDAATALVVADALAEQVKLLGGDAGPMGPGPNSFTIFLPIGTYTCADADRDLKYDCVSM